MDLYYQMFQIACVCWVQILVPLQIPNTCFNDYRYMSQTKIWINIFTHLSPFTCLSSVHNSFLVSSTYTVRLSFAWRALRFPQLFAQLDEFSVESSSFDGQRGGFITSAKISLTCSTPASPLALLQARGDALTHYSNALLVKNTFYQQIYYYWEIMCVCELY